jgi:DNA-binding NarL/FixJ family response regulator
MVTVFPYIELNNQQIDVLLYSSNGYTIKEIAHKKGVAVRAIEWRKQSIMKKFKARTWPQAVSDAFRLGIIE